MDTKQSHEGMKGADAARYLAAIVESSEDAIIGIDLNGVVTSWNRSAERVYGYTFEEMMGRPVSMLVAPGLGDEMPRILERIRRGERVEHYETLRRRKNGQIIHVALTVSPVRDAAGNVVGASKIARDITDRKRTEAALADLLERERTGREAAETAVRLHREAERNLSLLVEASDRLLGSVELPEVMAGILELAERFAAADAYAVWRVDPVEHRWLITASRGLAESFSLEYQPHEDPADWPATLVAVEDVTSAEIVARRRPFYAREGIRSLIAAPMTMHGRLRGTLTFYYREGRTFADIERRMTAALANLAASAISNAELYAEQKRMRREAEITAARASFLAQASVVIGSTLDLQATLNSLTHLVVPRFADGCSVDMLTRQGIERAIAQHVDPAALELSEQMRREYPVSLEDSTGVAQVLRTGLSELHAEITDEMLSHAARDARQLEDMRRLGIRSAMLVPFVVRGKTLGVITFIAGELRARYSPDDLAIAEQLALRAALAIDNANLFAAAERDRAESQAAAEALRESNQELERFAYVSSHDLQEPLRTVASYAQLLFQRYRGQLGPDADEFIGYIVDGALRMAGLIDALLSYSRLVRMGSPVVSPVDAGMSLASALRNLDKLLAESGAEVTCDPMPEVLAHGTQLAQVFQNLISNAVKYRRDVPVRIRISAVRDGAMWNFSVADNGIGISPQYWDRIFGMFKRLHGREIPGTGIGLATCKKIIEQHGGRLWLESTPGQGTTFHFSLPAVPAAQPATL